MPMVAPTQLPDVKLFQMTRHTDDRGYFAETYNRDAFVRDGIRIDFVQDNQSFSRAKGTVRGLHYQIHPHSQTKLIRVLRGAIFDVAVDLRRSSPTYGHHVNAVLSAETGNQLLVPVGFAHGFCTLEPDTEVLYKVDCGYAPECDRGICWSDETLGIDWPVTIRNATLSPRDRQLPRWADVEDWF